MSTATSDTESWSDVQIRPGRTIRLGRWGPRRRSQGSVHPVVVFLHGSMASAAQFRAQIEFVRDQQNATAVAFDALGCAGSDKPDDWAAYAEDEMLADAEAVVERFGVPFAEESGAQRGPVVLVGHSFGTCLAVRIASGRLKDRIGALVLLSTSATKPPAAAHPVFYLPVCLLRCLRGYLDRGFLAGAYYRPLSGARLEEARASLEQNPWHVIRPFYRQMRWDLVGGEDPPVDGVDCFVAVARGSHDAFISQEASDALATALRSRGVDVVDERWERAAHQLMEEQPRRTNALIAEALSMVRGER